MYLINNGEGGRLGNQFMRNFVLYFLVKKYNYKPSVKYHLEEDFRKLGLPFFNSDNNIKCENEEIISLNVIKSIQKETTLNDIDLKWGIKYFIPPNAYYQSLKYAKFMLYRFHKKDNEFIKRIIKKNKFNNRYRNNNDIFIHIRSGNFFRKFPPIIPGLEYYEYILESLKDKYDNIYICTDNNKNDIVRALRKKYKIIIPDFHKNHIDVILFGSTCKYVILSSGSYSFMIGLFSYHTKYIYFSPDAGKQGKYKDKRWHPDYYLAMDQIKFTKFRKIEV